jgi:hypothetical protein
MLFVLLGFTLPSTFEGHNSAQELQTVQTLHPKLISIIINGNDFRFA